jgi:hypothetical protein
MRFFGRSKHEPLTVDTSGPWTLIQGEHDGKPTIVRLNVGLRSILGHKRYPDQAGIAIRCNAPDERGFPSSKDTTALNVFEEQFVQLFCEGQSALFAAAISTNGMREFVFYVSDKARFREQFRVWAETPKSHRIQMMIQRDASWSVYQHFLPSEASMTERSGLPDDETKQVSVVADTQPMDARAAKEVLERAIELRQRGMPAEAANLLIPLTRSDDRAIRLQCG